MKPRFLADADLNQAIVNGVRRREPAVDFLGARASGLAGMSDPEVLTLAADSRRVLVSHDLGSMPNHFLAFRARANYSPGVFLVPHSLAVRAAIDELILIWQVSDALDWEDRITWLPL